jgi:phosphoribosylglycinamide formyltransferase 1
MGFLFIGVLASGGGSNLQSIIDRCADGYINGRVELVISNNSGAKALTRAIDNGIDALHISSITEGSEEKADDRIVYELLKRNIGLVVLAGYMKKAGDNLLKTYSGRIINIHPALLPKFGGKGMYGMNVHKAVIESGDTESGPTVHYVDGHYDHGGIIKQIKVPVFPDDTPETLQKRVLEKEHYLLPEVIKKIAEDFNRK